MVYSLTYELKSPDKDYTALFNFLEQGEDFDCVHVMRDCWWIASSYKLNINELVSRIRDLMGSKDHFFITPLSANDINGWLPSTSWSFYTDNMQ